VQAEPAPFLTYCVSPLPFAREEDTFNIRSTAVILRHVSKSMTAHMLSENFATDEAVSLNNEAHAIDPSVFLPQKNPTLVNREISRDLHACSESAMDVLASHKTKAVTSIACIGMMQDMGDFTIAFASILTLLSWACFLLKALSHFTVISC
jgi:hypothetical protein